MSDKWKQCHCGEYYKEDKEHICNTQRHPRIKEMAEQYKKVEDLNLPPGVTPE